MRFLIDTNWVIDALRGGGRSRQVRLRIVERNQDGIAMSMVTLAELSVGLHRTNDPLRARADMQELTTRFTLLDVDGETCEVFGQLKADLQRRGEAIGNFDTMIAATALQHDLTLLTNNARHFDRVRGLRTESG